MIISNSKNINFKNQFILYKTPINVFKLLEKINIQFLKLQFNNQSEVKLNNYTINFNSRVMFRENNKLKLTEKEINIITYLSKLNKPLKNYKKSLI